jgi:hypothetical protein
LTNQLSYTRSIGQPAPSVVVIRWDAIVVMWDHPWSKIGHPHWLAAVALLEYKNTASFIQPHNLPIT